MLEKVVNGVYITGGIALVMVVIIAMSSCSGKMYNVGTGEELSKSRCSGRYINK